MHFQELWSIGFWKELLSNDFNAGYVIGAGMVVGLLLFILILRLILKLIFRTRRCSSVLVPTADGAITIVRDAVEKAARQVLDTFPELEVRRIQLFRKGKAYSLLLFCSYHAGGKGVPEVTALVKPKMIDSLRKLFGIESLKCIDFRVEDFDGPAVAPVEIRPPAPLEKDDDNHADSGI